jgi:hypothetical protein
VLTRPPLDEATTAAAGQVEVRLTKFACVEPTGNDAETACRSALARRAPNPLNHPGLD